MKEFLAKKVLDNPVENYLWFLAIILVAFIIRKYLSQLVGSLLYKLFRGFSNRSEVRKFNTLMIRPTNSFVLLLTIFFAFELLKYPEQWKIHFIGYDLKVILNKLMAVMLTVSFTWMCIRMADFISYLLRSHSHHPGARTDNQLIPFVKDLFKIFIIIFSIFFTLGFIFHFNVASLITGLGIGGIAIALAAQDTLANLFASLTIFLDRPFVAGDLVTVGPVTGTVVRVGFRSTRIRTIDKTFVAVPNKKMVDDFLDNLTLRTHRRVKMTLFLSLQTQPESLKRAIVEIKQLYKAMPLPDEDNYVVFDMISEHAINLAIEYFVPAMDYKDFLNLKEDINFRIVEILNKNNCEFAEVLPVR